MVNSAATNEIELDDCQILVTGATGYTGGRLTRALVDRGYRVRVLVRPETELGWLAEAPIEVARGDVRNGSDVASAMHGVDVVFHLAALYRAAKFHADVYHQVNVTGTANVIQAAADARVQRLVHCSTIGVHGDVREIPANEESPYHPGDVYQRSKLEGEQLVQAAIAQGLPAVVVRPAGIYGPGDRRFLKLFRMVQSGRFRMFGSGKTFCHLVYIDDLIDGFLKCAEQPVAQGRTYILAGNEFTTLNELVTRVAEATRTRLHRRHLPFAPLWAAAVACETFCRPLGFEPPLHRRRVEFFVKNRAFTIDRARREIDFRPRVGVAEGIRRTADWYRQAGWLASSVV